MVIWSCLPISSAPARPNFSTTIRATCCREGCCISVTRAVREQRLAQANVDPATTKELFKQVELESVKIGATGEERDSGGSFVLVFGVGFIMYLAILMYGQVILGAVIEEKETRIAEILFSSVKPFTLMMGKLVGVSLVALTQLCIWGCVCGVRVLWCQHVDVTRRAGEYSENSLSHYIYFRCSSCSAISSTRRSTRWSDRW